MLVQPHNIAVFFVLFVPSMNIWFLPILMVLLFLTPACEVVRERHSRRQREWVDMLVFVLLILYSQSFLHVDLTYGSLRNHLRYYFGSCLFPMLAYFVFRLMRFSYERARNLRKTTLASGIILSMSCLYEIIFSHPFVAAFDNPEMRIEDSIVRAGSLCGGCIGAGQLVAGMIALTIPFIFFTWPGKRGNRLLWLLLIELMALGATFSRAAYISTLVCAIVVVFLLRDARLSTRLRAMVAVPAVLLLLLLPPQTSSRVMPEWLSERLSFQNNRIMRETRFRAGIDFIWGNINSGWRVALLGRGYHASYLSGGYYADAGLAESGDPGFLPGGFHNGYLTLLVDQGILAFACYVAIMIVALRRFLQYCRQLQFMASSTLRSPDSLEPVGWGLIIIINLVESTVHWSTGFPEMFFLFMALAMLFNFTSSAQFPNPGGTAERHACGRQKIYNA